MSSMKDGDPDDFDPEDLDPEEFYEEVQEPIPRPSRSFLAEKPRRVSFLPGLIFGVAAAVASAVSWNDPDLRREWIGNPEKIFMMGEWWRVFTSILLHSDMEHLLSNLLFLIPFAGLLTNYFGWKVFPVLGLALGIVTQTLSLKTYGLRENLLGASGFLYVLFGLWLALYYRAEKQLPWTNRLMRLVGFGLCMFIPSEFQSNVSYRTHFIGLAVGLLAGVLWRTKRLAVPVPVPEAPKPRRPLPPRWDMH